MRDFFRVMGKAFAIVFGSTSALALVLILLALAVRPILNVWFESPKHVPVSAPASMSTVTGEAPNGTQPHYISTDPNAGLPAQAQQGPWTKYQHPEQEKRDCPPAGYRLAPIPPAGFLEDMHLGKCDTKDGCTVYDSQHHAIGLIPRDEVAKAE